MTLKLKTEKYIFVYPNDTIKFLKIFDYDFKELVKDCFNEIKNHDLFEKIPHLTIMVDVLYSNKVVNDEEKINICNKSYAYVKPSECPDFIMHLNFNRIIFEGFKIYNTAYSTANPFDFSIINQIPNHEFINLIKHIFSNNIKGCIIHEVTHLVHFNNNNILKIKEKYENKIYSLYIHNYFDNADFFEDDLFCTIKDIRQLLMRLMTGIIMEGIASFSDCSVNYDISFSEKYFNDLIGRIKKYDEFKQKLEDFFKEIFELYDKKNNFSNDEFKKSVSEKLLVFKNYLKKKKIIYIFGFFIVYTILYFEKDINFNDLIKMRHSKVFHLYESLAKKHHLPLVFSYRNNDAYFSYFPTMKKVINLMKHFKS